MSAKNSSSKADLPVKLEVKRKGFEVSIEGKLSTIAPTIDEFASLVDLLTEKFGNGETVEEVEEPSQLPTAEEVSATSASDIPVIKPTKSSIENIALLFNTPWGRSPRTVAEVVKALEVNAVYERAEAVSTYLVRLVKKGVLRRIQREGKWAYVRTAGD